MRHQAWVLNSIYLSYRIIYLKIPAVSVQKNMSLQKWSLYGSSLNSWLYGLQFHFFIHSMKCLLHYIIKYHDWHLFLVLVHSKMANAPSPLSIIGVQSPFWIRRKCTLFSIGNMLFSFGECCKCAEIDVLGFIKSLYFLPT